MLYESLKKFLRSLKKPLKDVCWSGAGVAQLQLPDANHMAMARMRYLWPQVVGRLLVAPDDSLCLREPWGIAEARRLFGALRLCSHCSLEAKAL